MYSTEQKQKIAVERWIDDQETCPTRKQAAAHFPNVPQRIIRSLLQARKDREREISGS